jgi:Phage tail assembly chaperone protein, TAC
MKVALGRLSWAPAVFWAATPQEFWAAFEDWVEVNCIRMGDGTLSEEEIARLEAMKRRFPDRAEGGK